MHAKPSSIFRGKDVRHENGLQSFVKTTSAMRMHVKPCNCALSAPNHLLTLSIHVQQTMEIAAQQREREIETARSKYRDALACQKKKGMVRILMLFVLVGPPKESKPERRRRLHGQGRHSKKKQVLRVQIPLSGQSPCVMFLANDDGKEESWCHVFGIPQEAFVELVEACQDSWKSQPIQEENGHPAPATLLNNFWIVLMQWL
jgi:hypothetical protein